MDKTESMYKTYQYNRPVAQKLLRLAKSEGLQVTSKEVKEFLACRVEEQQLTETKSRMQRNGHVISLNLFNKLRLDIFVLQKYESSNNCYAYILCIIDIFSTKELSDTTPAIKKFFSTSGLHEFNKRALVIIMSDSDIMFKGSGRES